MRCEPEVALCQQTMAENKGAEGCERSHREGY